MLETISLENAIKICTPLARKLYEEKIKPIITDRISQLFQNWQEKKKFEKEVIKYIARTTGICTTINTIAFPNTPKKLEELYIPLTIKDDKDKKIEINKETDIFKNNNKVLVNDTAGMGKSTLSKRVYLNIIDKKDAIPVFIELRQLTKDGLAIQIANRFGINSKKPIEILNKLPLVFIFDGLDEISSENKELIIMEIRKFIDELENPKILITSRLESYLSYFYDFTRFNIIPLDEEEAYKLISKYDPQGDISKNLILGIERSKDRGIEEFLSTPLYVSLLFCAYRHKTVIPQKKHLFYSQVYEALFESHDLSKEIGFVRPKYSNLDSPEFHLLLRRFGFWCLKNGSKIEFQKDELEIVIKDIISSTSGINTSAVNFVKDLTSTVPLFVKEGSSLRWSHKSLMEYFSSMFICHDTKEKQTVILEHLFRSNEWVTYKIVFELCADIDFTSLRSSVVKHVLENSLTYKNNNYLEIKNSRIKKEDIEKRVSISFGRVSGFKIIESESFDLDNFDFLEDNGRDALELKKLCKEKKSSISHFITFAGKSVILHGLNIFSRDHMILEILKIKTPHIFKSNDRKRRISIPNEILKSKLKRNKFHIISDKPSEAINNSVNFNIVSEYLLQTGGFILDYNQVELELETITEDTSNGIDLLIGDIC